MKYYFIWYGFYIRAYESYSFTYKDNFMTTKTKIALGLVGAAAAGVLIGLLIAPEKGKDMRKKLKKTAGDWAENLSTLFVKGQEEVEDLKDKGRNVKAAVEEKVNKLKESLG